MGKQLWDVIAQIVVVIHEHNFKDYFEHVKCHQDKDTKYEDLQLLAELNVDVNTLAVAFCTHNMKCTKQTIHLPSNYLLLFSCLRLIFKLYQFWLWSRIMNLFNYFLTITKF